MYDTGMKVQGLAFIMCNVCNVSLVHSVAVVRVALFCIFALILSSDFCTKSTYITLCNTEVSAKYHELCYLLIKL